MSPPMTPVRVVVADDHPVVRAGLAALLQSLPEIEVVAVAANGQDAIKEVLLHRPAVAILDLQMPLLDGFAATVEIARLAPEVAVLVLTMFDDEDSVFTAMRAGARGYIVKGAEQDEIARAVHAVAAGEAIFSPGVAHRVLRFFSTPPSLPAVPFPELTGREREILALLAGNLGNAAIAARLGLSPKTVANHLSWPTGPEPSCGPGRPESIARAASGTVFQGAEQSCVWIACAFKQVIQTQDFSAGSEGPALLDQARSSPLESMTLRYQPKLFFLYRARSSSDSLSRLT